MKIQILGTSHGNRAGFVQNPKSTCNNSVIPDELWLPGLVTSTPSAAIRLLRLRDPGCLVFPGQPRSHVQLLTVALLDLHAVKHRRPCYFSNKSCCGHISGIRATAATPTRPRSAATAVSGWTLLTRWDPGWVLSAWIWVSSLVKTSCRLELGHVHMSGIVAMLTVTGCSGTAHLLTAAAISPSACSRAPMGIIALEHPRALSLSSIQEHYRSLASTSIIALEHPRALSLSSIHDHHRSRTYTSIIVLEHP
ncbi:hypothetical protein J6590_052185 [Homalodisca vitripennis]|nr:hypothetical protein J6590_052185 [Homalodisca vitripennis]